MFQIGAFGRLAGISAKQLRAYDAIGLFRPVWVDPSSGYRYYSPAQLPDLRRILALRQLGMPLSEIGRVAGGAGLRDALVARREALESERRALDERLTALQITMSEEADPDVVVRPVAAEPVAVVRVDGAISDAFYALESYVRDLGRRAHRPPGAIPSAREIFVPVTGPVPDTDRITYRRLPAGRMAALIHRGSYAGVARARVALRRWVEAAALVPAGPMRTLYLQFGAEPELRFPRGYVVASDADFITELQVPVRQRDCVE